MADQIEDYEDLNQMLMTDEQIEALVGTGGAGLGECVFNWTNSQGYPVGVVVAYVFRDGKFWTTCAERRARVPALRKRPQSAIVINNPAITQTVTYKGDSIVHAHGDADWDEVSGWFYSALSGTEADPTNQGAKDFQKFLDSPSRVIIETEANLVVAFDGAKMGALTQQAVAAGGGAQD